MGKNFLCEGKSGGSLLHKRCAGIWGHTRFELVYHHKLPVSLDNGGGVGKCHMQLSCS